MIQAGRSRVRDPMRSMNFFSTDQILPAALGLWFFFVSWSGVQPSPILLRPQNDLLYQPTDDDDDDECEAIS
jgi:hypothetical protein